jgi:hypothetical protein
MLESDLEGAKEFVAKFKARLSVLYRNKNRQGKTDIVGKRLPKKTAGTASEAAVRLV